MLNNSNPAGGLPLASGPSVPVLTPEAIALNRLVEKAKAFDADLAEVIKKHKPMNICVAASFGEHVDGPEQDMATCRRINATKLGGDVAANLFLCEFLLQAAKNQLGLR